jgi:membrane-anchored protein YejM (alkaline phosphatase superfamily)
MDELLFGKERSLLSSYKEFPHPPPDPAYKADGAALASCLQDLEENPSLREGQVFILFFDSTHFDYSWPKEKAPKFSPIARESSYFTAFYSDEKIERIKNRYRNAVFYIDSLFGKFLEAVPNQDEAIVIVTGDHGEEFFENGHLFHLSHISHQQTNIPLYMKFGRESHRGNQPLASQMDVFPSILHYLKGEECNYFQGASIFSKERWPYVFIARYNASRTPYEFCLHNGRNKLIAQFSDPRDIYSSKQLKIRSLTDWNDRCLFKCKKHVKDYVESEFGPAFDRMFREHP